MAAGELLTKSWKPGTRFAEAAQFAIDVHREDTRKGSDVPYIGHLFGVCALVLEEGGSEDQALAALLHDTAEDHGGRKMLEQVQALERSPVVPQQQTEQCGAARTVLRRDAQGRFRAGECPAGPPWSCAEQRWARAVVPPPAPPGTGW